jgi:hypothetical protein
MKDPRQITQGAMAILVGLVGLSALHACRPPDRHSDPVPLSLWPTLAAASSEKRAVIERYFAGLASDKQELIRSGRAHVPRSHAARVTWEKKMVTQGMARLDDSSVLAHNALLSRILAATDEQTCSAIGRGHATEQQFFGAMLALDSASIQHFLEIQRRALNLGIRQEGEAAPSEDAGEEALAALQDQLPPADAERYQAWDPERALAEENCWVSRALGEAAAKLPPHQAVTALRYVHVLAVREQ